MGLGLPDGYTSLLDHEWGTQLPDGFAFFGGWTIDGGGSSSVGFGNQGSGTIGGGTVPGVPPVVPPVPPTVIPPDPVINPSNFPAQGQPIPIWIGTAPDIQGRVVWASKMDARGRISFAVCFGRNEFDRDFTYINIKADQRTLYDVTGTKTVQNPPVMRMYNSKDNVPDPLMIDDVGADLANAMMGHLIVYFENFRTAPYQYRLPIITATISDTTDDVDLNETLGTFDDFVPSFFAAESTDWYNRRLVHIIEDSGFVSIGFVSVDAGYEFVRTPVHGDVGPEMTAVLMFEMLPGTSDVIMEGFTLSDITGSYYVVSAMTGEATYIADNDIGLLATRKGIVAVPVGLPGSGLVGIFFLNKMTVGLWNSVERSYTVLNDTFLTDIAPEANTAVVGRFNSLESTIYYLSTASPPDLCEVKIDGSSASFRTVYTFGGSDTDISLCYDITTDAVVAVLDDGTDTKFRSISVADGTILYDVDAPTGSEFTPKDRHFLQDGYGIVKAIADETGYHLVDLSDGSYVSVSSELATTLYYDQFTGSKYTIESGVNRFWRRFGTTGATPDTVPLTTVLTLLATRAGYEVADIVTNGFEDLVVYTCYIDRDYSIRDLIASICSVFGIDHYESSGKYKFVKIGRDGDYAVTRVIDIDEVGQQTGDNPSVISGSDSFDGGVPERVMIRYLDKDQEFNAVNQEHLRPSGVFGDVPANRDITLSAPIAMTPAAAKAMAIERAYEFVTSRKRYTFTLPPEHSDLEPADILTIPVIDEDRDVKITRTTLRDDYALVVDAEDVLIATDTTYTASVTSYEPPEPVSDETLFYYLDGPLLSVAEDLDDDLLMYGLLSGLRDANWVGGKLLVQPGQRFTSTELPFVGAATHVLEAPAANWSTDYDNTLNVRILSGTADMLSVATHAQVMNNANMAFVGKPGRWEIIQWETVTEEADGTVTLGILQRGRLGSEVYQGDHLHGDYFIPVNRDALLVGSHPLTALDGRVYYKAWGIKTTPDTVNIQSAVASGTAETPYAPTDLAAVIDGSDIDLSWSRRSRYRASYLDEVYTLPLGEASESYEIDIMDGGDVVRTLTATTEAKTYLDADITADFGSMPATLTFRVYQMSARVGRGFRASATITL